MKNLGEKHNKSNDYGKKSDSIVVKGAKIAGKALMGAVIGGSGAALALSGVADGIGESVGATDIVRGVREALGK